MARERDQRCSDERKQTVDRVIEHLPDGKSMDTLAMKGVKLTETGRGPLDASEKK
jgi:hypothetical protein